MSDLAGLRTDPDTARIGRSPLRRLRVPAAHPRVRDALVISLTLLTGAMDSVAFLRLDNVFTSVMTGNMVLMGMGIGRGDWGQLEHAAIAVVAYIAGAMIGGRVSGRIGADDSVWPAQVTLALAVEFLLFAVVNVMWFAGHARPGGTEKPIMVALAALALGIQSSAVIRLNVSGLSTTYLTGTLTSVARSLMVDRRFRGNGRSTLVLLALISGAALGAVLAIRVPLIAAVPPLIILAVVLGAAVFVFHAGPARDRVPKPRTPAGRD
jgi:uncharacterized membrane protein YoaK (UPF0700 family)